MQQAVVTELCCPSVTKTKKTEETTEGQLLLGNQSLHDTYRGESAKGWHGEIHWLLKKNDNFASLTQVIGSGLHVAYQAAAFL